MSAERDPVAEFFAAVAEAVLEKPCSLDEIAHGYSDGCDRVVLKAIQNERLSFIGGHLDLELSEDGRAFNVIFEAWFQTAQGDWVRKANQQRHLLHDLTAKADAELRRLKHVKYDLTAPDVPGPAR